MRGANKQANYQSQEIVQYKRKRRARDDPMERNYICSSCGKSYLSYPALYTHNKNKHQGRAPTPGQARNNEARVIVQREQPENQHQKYLTTPDEALVYIINIFKGYSMSKQLNYTIQDIFGIYPEELGKDVEEMARVMISGQKAPIEKILDNGIKAITIDWIFGKFIGLLMNKIDKNLLEQFLFVLLIFRKYLNLYFSKSEPTSREYTKQVSGLKMLENANEFALYYFEIYAKQYRHCISEACFINRPNREFIGISKFMFLFSRWTFLERYTNSKIKLNNF